MGVVTLGFAASASHVRTARLVSVTLARRCGLDEDRVEAVRQAVGEACAMAVTQAEANDSMTRVTRVTLTMDDDRPGEALHASVHPVRPAGPGGDLSLVVLTELTDQHQFTEDEHGPLLRLTWLSTP